MDDRQNCRHFVDSVFYSFILLGFLSTFLFDPRLALLEQRKRNIRWMFLFLCFEAHPCLEGFDVSASLRSVQAEVTRTSCGLRFASGVVFSQWGSA